MNSEHFSQFFPAVCAGFGLFLVGLVNLFAVRRSVLLRSLATLSICGLTLAAASSLDQPGASAGTARFLALGLLPCLLLSSGRVVALVSGLITSLQLPAVRFGLLSVAGVGTVVGSIVMFERADEQLCDESLADLEMLHSKGPFVLSIRGSATTDQGTTVVLKESANIRETAELTPSEARMLKNAQLDEHVIRRSSANDHSNCHGWVFTGGKFVLGPEEVEMILKENGYQLVQEPQPGDVVIYRDGGVVSHTALVRYVTEGQPVLVEGKWGSFGVFLHPGDKSPYGTDYSFHRSSRRGHLLAGVGGPTSPTTQPAPAVTE